MTEQCLEKIYTGFLGMNIGIRLGAPVEPTVWTSERIERFYGEINGYVKPFQNFAADDDANGPVFFLRALYDRARSDRLTPQDVADAWLNYAREGKGMFWWGGYGVSTEHTAYLNLKSGIPAPRSGSAEVNGLTLAEQIGGQIFIDTWGLVWPGDPEKAAEYAGIAASVSHDGNGIWGGRFIAACIAQAFLTDNVREIIDAGLAQIPQDCTYAKVVRAVLEFYAAHPDDFRACLRYLQENWGYDRYPGVCHIIPNAGVCVLAMLYGGGDFARTVEIAAMCGWDTDCNAGNVGTILGTAGGLAALPERYRAPINDSIVLSGISGSLNILDIPTYAKELARLACSLKGEPLPDFVKGCDPRELHFDFELPGATHNLRVSNPGLCRLRHTTSRTHSGNGAAEVLFNRMSRGQKCKIYYKPFYRRADFDDERYMPVFSPTAYPGQTVSVWAYAERITGESIILTPYVRESLTGRELLLGGVIVKEAGWQELRFTIPPLAGGLCDELGLMLESNSPAKNRDFGCLYLDDFSITGKACCTIEMGLQREEFGSVTPFSHNHGAWSLENGQMQVLSLEPAEAMTGHYFMRDLRVTGRITPFTGRMHFVSARVQGALRGCYGGLSERGAALYQNDHGMRLLAECPFAWTENEQYEITLTACADRLALAINGQELLTYQGDIPAYGMVGYALPHAGRAQYGDLTIEEF